MDELFAGWRLVPPRLRSSWRLLSVTAVGVLVAAALLAAVPLYSSALSELGLRFRLQRALGESRLNSVAVEQLFLGDAADLARRRSIDAVFDARVGWLGEERLVEERSPRLFLDLAQGSAVAAGGEAVTHQPWNAFLYWLSDYERYVTVTEGRLPGPPGEPPEVVLPDGFQRHAVLGETITWPLESFDDCERLPPSGDPEVARQELGCTATTHVAQIVSATVVGFVRANDPGDPRWAIFAGSFEVPDEPLLPHVAEPDPNALLPVPPEVLAAVAGEGSMPLLTSQQQLFGPFAAAMPYLPTRHRVGLVANIDAISPGDVQRGIEGLGLLRADLTGRLGLAPDLRFPLGEVLSRFRNTQSFEQIPLLIHPVAGHRHRRLLRGGRRLHAGGATGGGDQRLPQPRRGHGPAARAVPDGGDADRRRRGRGRAVACRAGGGRPRLYSHLPPHDRRRGAAGDGHAGRSPAGGGGSGAGAGGPAAACVRDRAARHR